VATGRNTSLAVRAVALVFALALAALAAWLWLGDAPRETSASRGDSAAADDAVATAPPLHEEHSAEDQEALRGILRGDESRAP
jgi:hypothetical protein